MASSHRGASVGPSRDKSYFEQQREALLGDIAMVFLLSFPFLRSLQLRGGQLTSPNLARADESFAQSFEQVLGNINKLNRSLESIIAVRFEEREPQHTTRLTGAILGGQRVFVGGDAVVTV